MSTKSPRYNPSFKSTQFKTCETNLKNGALSGCVIGCSATVTMLKISETPVITLTEGKFGTNTNLVAAGKGPAPNPICTRKVNGEEVSNPFGSFADTSSGCNPPQGTVFPDFNIYPSDDICEQANSGGASDSASPTPGELLEIMPLLWVHSGTTAQMQELVEEQLVEESVL